MTSLRRNSKGMNGHFQPNEGKNNEWLTPPEIIRAVGPFDLDPCSPISRPWDTAALHYTIEDNGLCKDWSNNFIYCNPPFNEITQWMCKMSSHNNGIALAFARTDTEWFHKYVFGKASSLFFIRQRPHFYRVDGSRASFNAGGPIVLIGYGDQADLRLAHAQANGLKGAFVTL